MKENILKKINRKICMGPPILLSFLTLEFLTYLIAKEYSFPIGLSIKTQIILSVPFAGIFIAGYLSFVITYFKHDVGTKVIQTGPYRLVRHPLYATDIITIPGVITIWLNDIIYIIPWFLALIVTFFLVKIEENYMQQKFGEEYLEYKREVPAIIPWKGVRRNITN